MLLHLVHVEVMVHYCILFKLRYGTLLHLVQVDVMVCYCILFKLKWWCVTASCSC